MTGRPAGSDRRPAEPSRKVVSARTSGSPGLAGSTSARPVRTDTSGAGGSRRSGEARRSSPAGVTPAHRAHTARALALEALVEIDGVSGAAGRANIVVPALLDTSDLARRDRAFVTEMVYGTVRMQRACDWLVDRHLRRPIEAPVRAALRVGAYQLAFLHTPPHAAVSATVAEIQGPARGLVNAVLRRVAHDVKAGVAWPSDAVRLSYPDWIMAELSEALGPDEAYAAMEQMNLAAGATTRDDGYIQDLASQWAAAAVGTGPGERVADLCAAPGGKATFLASGDAGPSIVVAGDLDPRRVRQVAENAAGLGLANVATVAMDGCRPPFSAATFDRVLVDAPCSGLGVLRRRPDARWRIQPGDVGRLVGLQQRLLDAAVELVRPGGRVVYSVCTLTRAETTGIDDWLASAHPEARAIDLDLDPAWQRVGRGARLLPQAASTDGMFLLAVQAPGPDSSSVSP
jgi:16S rRNA (cytosine967-C5)-methyltransferase